MKKFFLTTIALFAIQISVAQIGPSFTFYSGGGYSALSFGVVYQIDVDWTGFELQTEANYSAHNYRGDDILGFDLGVSITSIDARGTIHFFPVADNDAFFIRGGLGLYTFITDWVYGTGLGYHLGLGYKVSDEFSLIAEFGGIGYGGLGLGIQYIF